jgi:signal transduction histidine kinase
MAAEIAHELNNFLAVLSGNAELLTMTIGESVPEKVQKRLGNMCETIERIRVFTDNLLHSRHPSGQKSTIDLNAFLANQIAFLHPQKRIKKIPIYTEWGAALPEMTCDASAVQQVFYNLILNAADALATSNGSDIGVWVKTEYLAGPRQVRLTVADSGPGIPADLLPALFKERVSTKPTGHGFGLLTIARIINEHGGSIAVRNRDEGGALFEVLLPVIPPTS